LHRLPRPALKPLTLLVCALWQAHAAHGQAQTPQSQPLALQLSPQLDERLGDDQRNQAPMFISGQSMVSETDTVLKLDGEAEIRRPDMVLRADQIQYDQAEDRVRAQGHVHINQSGSIFEGPKLELRLEAFEGTFEKPSFQFPINDAHGDADRIEFLDPKRSVVHNATFTTCRRVPGPDWVPDWILRAATMSFDTEDESAEAEDAKLQFMDTTLVTLPAISFPLSNKRRSGLLPPVFGADSVSGTVLTTPYYWNIAPNRDATFYPTVMSQRGVNYGGEFRYLEADYYGRFRADYMPGDFLRGSDRSSVSYQHTGVIDTGYEGLGKLGLNLNLNRVSDDNYWRDFSSPTTGLTSRLLTNDVGLTWSKGAYSAGLRTTQYQTIQDSTSPIVPPYDRLPQITGKYLNYGAGTGFDVQVDGDLTSFRADRTLTGQVNADRSVLNGQLSYPIVGSGGFFTPKVALNTATYNFDAPLSTGQTTATRTVPTYSLDTGLVFERDASFYNHAYRQTLEPRLFYVYTPYVEQNYLPNYDSAAADYNFSSIYSENTFTGYDRISNNRMLTAGVTSRLLDPDHGNELAHFGIAQRYRYEDQRVILPNGSTAAAGFSDVLVGAGVTLDTRWYLDSLVQYNPTTESSVRSTVSARYNPSNYRVFNVAYRFQRDVSELADIGWQWPLNDLWGDRGTDLGPGQGQGAGRWYSVGRLNYSLMDGKLVDSLVGLEYDAGCWLGRVVFERLTTGLVTSTQRIMFQLEFVGFSRLGIDPLSTLRNTIPRYQYLRSDQQVTTPSRFGNYD
jgi:LPS-assembly protein